MNSATWEPLNAGGEIAYWRYDINGCGVGAVKHPRNSESGSFGALLYGRYAPDDNVDLGPYAGLEVAQKAVQDAYALQVAVTTP